MEDANTTELRKCSKCGELKSLSDYYIDKRWNVPYGRCKKCQNTACVARGIVPVSVTPERVKAFWKLVSEPSSKHGCAEWIGQTIKGGYGKCNQLEGEQLAHRVAWMLVNGPIPDRMVIMHRCDNPPCCRTDHLQAASQSENMADCHTKGRIATGDRHGTKTRPNAVARGERAGKAKLSESDIPTIRKLLAQRTPLRTIAAMYGVDSKTIHAIKTRRTWSHVF